MEQNRNVDFDSDVEIVSLKNAVWRLTTRVYLLEDFIAERFGEVIGPSGFTTKATATSCSPIPDPISSTIKDSVYGNSISSSPIIRRRRKRNQAVSCETEGQSQKTQKTTEKETNIESDVQENIAILGLDFESNENDPLLILKDEVIHSDCGGGNTNDYILHESRDDDDERKKDPDFNLSPHDIITDDDDDGSMDMQDRGPNDCDGSNQKSNLKTHMKIQRKDEPFGGFSCFICKKSYTRQTSLDEHSRTHTGEKPFVCKICGKRFAAPSSLRIHIRVHTGEKPFICTICGTGFARSSSLKVHYRTHTGEKPYSCSVCGKRFSDYSSFIRHKKTHK